MRLADLPTPCLVLDRVAVRDRLRAMAAAAAARRLAWRFETCAAKSVALVRLAGEAAREAGLAEPGLAVSTLAEAEYFAAHDATDILYAVPLAPSKLDQVAKLAEAGAALLAVTADTAAAAAIAAHRAPPGVLLVLEADEDGTGLDAEHSDLAAIARLLGPLFRGLLVQGGGAPAQRLAAGRAAERLFLAGLRPGIVSLAEVGAETTGATEWRAGARLFEGAGLSVLATVIGRREAGPDRAGRITLDAGTVALGAAGAAVRALAGAAPPGPCLVRPDGPEQAQVELHAGASVPELGARVHLAPERAGLAAAAHDRYFVVDGDDDAVVAIWPRVGGW